MFKTPARVIVTAILFTAMLLAATVSGCHPVSTSQIQEPIEIVSVLGPVPPPTPGGPAVKITLKNVGVEPVISLTATLGVDTPFGTPDDFTFDDVSPSNPLQPDGSTSDTRCLIGGGFSSSDWCPLTINATLQNGTNFVYTKLVQIQKPVCFIATAAYGTPMAEEIRILREFRDKYLLTDPLGRGLVEFYYKVSPPMAEFISEHPTLKPIVRAALLPAVLVSTIVVNSTPAEKVATTGLLALILLGMVVWAKRWRGRSPEHVGGRMIHQPVLCYLARRAGCLRRGVFA
jgi:hypothetical protein